MSKIRKSAKGEACTLRIPGVCNGNPETVVLCHAPYPGRGGMRNHDWWAAYGCSDCHDYIDARTKHCRDIAWLNGLAAFWMPAIHETQAKLKAKGLL